ncbi:leucine-rich repeat domain-containing protein [Paenibacillus sp. H1-7]|uniref:leucine-rich repeat domain-containing protein n=1 Tax=Paenibacillus sp. H1-7 TaxID=2282849 RepID=UPI001EF795C8|nr:leucine-rich repeat domain-containing protein [Paenibacillus sp. H1-7]ULL13101.1 leucine-rich repeat domain-containing protein [Paenibacillus sp. H1-7]
MIQIYNDPKGEAYRRLIDYAIEHSSMFVLATREQMYMNENCHRVLRLLEPYLIKQESCDSLRGKHSIAYSNGGTVYFYACHSEAAQVLRSEAERLLAWSHPHLPEDLGFLDADGNDWLTTVAHEDMAGIHLEEDEANALSRQIDGLFLRGEFNAGLDDLLDDALRHRAERLHITGFDLYELPDKVSRIHTLKTLYIFEHHIRSLPENMFQELRQLEELTVYTADLLPFPKEIGSLTRLKRLTVGCGSYYRLDEGQSIIRKEDVSFDRLPAEIGRLTELEHLFINYTSLRRLPSEAANLRNLVYADLSNNLFDAEPVELLKLPKLQHVAMYNNPVSGSQP